MRNFLILFLSILAVSLIIPVYSESGNTSLYSTWETIEFDTCASAWLIKKFINKNAEFKFFPKGELVTEGTPFDTPDAELRRKNNMSTYEVILKKYKVTDPILIEIGKIVHEVEITYWGDTSKISKETGKKIMNIISGTKKDEQKCFEESFKVFDDLYEKIKNSE